MGILDDAIREHLELKRRQGASEEELRQQEVEALGVLSDAEPDDAAELADGNGGQAIPEEELLAEPPAELAEPELAEPEPVEPEPVEPELAEPVEPEPELSELAEPEPVQFEEPQVAEPAPEPHRGEPDPDEPEAAFPGEEEPPPRSGDTPAQGFDAVEEHGEHEEAEEDADEPDVLEDTPDFLQETPEHDRLWFEQKPPRDFDFD